MFDADYFRRLDAATLTVTTAGGSFTGVVSLGNDGTTDVVTVSPDDDAWTDIPLGAIVAVSYGGEKASEAILASPPKTRAENDRMTLAFTSALAAFARGSGAKTSTLSESGNAGDGDDAYTFDATIGGQTFNVEVFGPHFEEASA